MTNWTYTHTHTFRQTSLIQQLHNVMLMRTFKHVWPSKAVKLQKDDCGINKRLLTLHFKMLMANVSSIDSTQEWIFIYIFYSLIITQHQKSSFGFTYSKLWRGPQDNRWNSTPTGLRSLPSTGVNAARWFHKIKVQLFFFQNLHSLCSSVEKRAAVRPQLDLLGPLQSLKMAKVELRRQLLFSPCLKKQHMLVRYVLKHGGWFELV